MCGEAVSTEAGWTGCGVDASTEAGWTGCEVNASTERRNVDANEGYRESFTAQALLLSEHHKDWHIFSPFSVTYNMFTSGSFCAINLPHLRLAASLGPKAGRKYG